MKTKNKLKWTLTKTVERDMSKGKNKGKRRNSKLSFLLPLFSWTTLLLIIGELCLAFSDEPLKTATKNYLLALTFRWRKKLYFCYVCKLEMYIFSSTTHSMKNFSMHFTKHKTKTYRTLEIKDRPKYRQI